MRPLMSFTYQLLSNRCSLAKDESDFFRRPHPIFQLSQERGGVKVGGDMVLKFAQDATGPRSFHHVGRSIVLVGGKSLFLGDLLVAV